MGNADTTDEFDDWFAVLEAYEQVEVMTMAKSFDQLVKRTTTKATQRKAARRTRELLGELLLSEIRHAAGKSQRELADALGIKQPSLSKLEAQDDMHVSTLKKIVKALGGHLHITATFPKGDVGVKLSSQDKSAHVRAARELELV